MGMVLQILFNKIIKYILIIINIILIIALHYYCNIINIILFNILVIYDYENYTLSILLVLEFFLT